MKHELLCSSLKKIQYTNKNKKTYKNMQQKYNKIYNNKKKLKMFYNITKIVN